MQTYLPILAVWLSLIGSFFFGRLYVLYPKNPLIRNGKREREE
tara:strand:- start:593 stop:721 length:129 start_codon:yes stop_codon:yes gene_type:complete